MRLVKVGRSWGDQVAEALFAPASGSGQTDPLVSEMRSLATTEYPLCQEARMLLEMAARAQETGKMPDLTPLGLNDPSSAAPTP